MLWGYVILFLVTAFGRIAYKRMKVQDELLDLLFSLVGAFVQLLMLLNLVFVLPEYLKAGYSFELILVMVCGPIPLGLLIGSIPFHRLKVRVRRAVSAIPAPVRTNTPSA